MTEALQQKNNLWHNDNTNQIHLTILFQIASLGLSTASRHSTQLDDFSIIFPSHAKYPVMYLKSRHVRAPQPLQPIAGPDLPKAQS